MFLGVSFSGPTAVADYNAYAIAHGYVDPTGGGNGPYVPFTSAPQLNTTLFGTVSILSQDRREAFASVNYDLFEKQVQFFGQFLFSQHRLVRSLKYFWG